MAQNISEHGQSGNVVQMKRGRGRPKGTGKAAPKIVQTKSGPEIQEEFLPDAADRAPGFGHNAPDASVFLRHVQLIRRQDEVIAEAKLKVKSENGKRKDLRKLAQADGLVMGQLDEALDDLELEHVDLIAREERRRLYHEWLNIPLTTQGDLPNTVSLDPKNEAVRWFKRGDTDGRLDKVRSAPAGCPPEHHQDYFKGHDAGCNLRMQHTPLTAGAFDTNGSLKSANDPAPAAAPVGDKGILVLNEGHFEEGTLLEDANMITLLQQHHEAVLTSERVVALFGTKRRILKEPNDDGTTYLDDGLQETAVTDPEPVDPAAPVADLPAGEFA